MKDTENLEVSGILVRAKVGSFSLDCIHDAAIMSLRDRVDVVLYHNDQEYKINYSDILNKVLTSVNWKKQL